MSSSTYYGTGLRNNFRDYNQECPQKINGCPLKFTSYEELLKHQSVCLYKKTIGERSRNATMQSQGSTAANRARSSLPYSAPP